MHPVRPLLPVLMLLGAGCAAAASNGAAPPFDVRDLVRLPRLAEIAVSPDGNRVAYTLRAADLQANRGRTAIWVLDAGRRNPAAQRLSGEDGSDVSAEWSADGRHVYFLSSRSGRAQVWRVDAAGGNPLQVTDFPLDVGSFRVSPKGDRLIVSLTVYRDCPDLACTRERLDVAAQAPAGGILYERLFVRHWDGWNDGRRSQLFSVALDERGMAAGAAVNLTAALDADVPQKPLGGREDYAISPDGGQVAFVAAAAAAAEPWSTNSDVFLVDIQGGAVRNVTADNPARDCRPLFSPDGTQLAYLAAERPGFAADRLHLVLFDLKAGTRRPLTDHWDRSIDGAAWSRDGRTLFATTDHLGQHPLWAIDAAGGRAAAITGAGRVENFGVGAQRVYYAQSSLAGPADLYAVGFAGGRATQLTQLHKAALARRKLGEYEQFSFDGANGDTVFGYVLRPAEFKQNRKYPFVLLLHGGPEANLANEWNQRWNPQVFAGAGFGVVMIDFHGSTGYGQAFTDAIKGDWGGKPLQDLKAGIAAALKQYPWLDGVRACAAGASYGGYLVNWIEGAWPERFKCLVSQAGTFDQRSLYYTTDELWLPEWELGGTEYGTAAGYARHNPIDGVPNWRTPLLVIAGQLDYRVPYDQALGAFTALQRRGIPSQLLLYPDENHWILKPADTVQWYDTVIAWLNRWTAP